MSDESQSRPIGASSQQATWIRDGNERCDRTYLDQRSKLQMLRVADPIEGDGNIMKASTKLDAGSETVSHVLAH
jgi:hypothetical protein